MATTIEPEVSEQRPARGEPASRGSTEFRPAPNGGRRNKIFAGLGIVLLVLIAGGVRKWIWSRTHVSSDNAQVDGHILPVLPKVGGYVLSIRVEENQAVKAGDTILTIDDKDYAAKLQQADADLAVALANVSSRQRVGQADAAVRQAQANADRAHADLDRIQPLVEQGVVSRQQLDAAVTTSRAADAALASAQAALLGADARVAAARASRDWAALQLSYTRILAPTSGVVSKKSVEVGQLVQPGQPLMTVVPLSDVWVTANLKETETTHVVPGDTVQFTVDAYPGCHFGGRVESLSPATGARFSLLPPDNATGNFTKVVQRIPVRIRPVASIDCQGRELRPGMSVVATITTK
ncbi:MAG TPA: HlyD family secretion protein [Gemmatimonadales bacterium]|nr:HlyD family secretion protein [Gemmatimonadales bacterium]